MTRGMMKPCWRNLLISFRISSAIVGRRNFAQATAISQSATAAAAAALQQHARNRRLVEMAGLAVTRAEIEARRREFDAYQSSFIDEISGLHPMARDLPEVSAWWRRALEYNLRGGKKNRGLIAYLACVKLSEKDGVLTEDRRRGAAALGFGLEMLQASFLVEDDIMDKSETRRDQPCWYRVPGVGLMAINDASMLECTIHNLIKSHCEKSRNYRRILDLFQDTRLKTIAGQALDGIAERERYYSGLKGVTMDRYRRIIRYKTAYYSFHCPMIAGMLLAEWDDPEMLQELEAILLKIGEYFQSQDDYLDCYGDEAKTGKKGTDIQDGKCTWLLVTAVDRATPAQKQLLQDNLGSNDPEKVSKVKATYDELDIPGAYAEFEDKAIADIESDIKKCRAGESVACLLYSILGLISKRQS